MIESFGLDDIILAAKKTYTIEGFNPLTTEKEDEYHEVLSGKNKEGLEVVKKGDEKIVKFTKDDKVISSEKTSSDLTSTDRDQEILDAIAGLEIMLNQVSDDKKSELNDALEGLKLMLNTGKKP